MELKRRMEQHQVDCQMHVGFCKAKREKGAERIFEEIMAENSPM